MDLQSVRTKLAVDLRSSLVAAEHAGPVKPVIVVSAPGGIGKTRMTADLLRLRSVTWLSPRNDAQRELEGFLDNPLADIEPLKGDGPGRPAVQKRMARVDPGACSRPERFESVLARGEGRFMERLSCRECPARSHCAYQQWRPTDPWLFAPHTWLALGTDTSALYAGRDFVVIDETPLPTMLGGIALGAHEVRLVRDKLQRASLKGRGVVVGEGIAMLFDQILDLIDRPPPGRTRVVLRELAADLGLQFVSRYASLKNPFGGQLRDPSRTQLDPLGIQSMLRALQLHPELAEKVHGLADAVADDGPGAGAHRPACVLVLPGDDRIPGIVAGHFRDARIPKSVPIVILDATTEPVLYRYVFDRPVVTVKATLEQRSRIVQTIDSRYPTATLERAGSPAVDRVMQIADRFKAENPGASVALIMKKGTYEGAARVRVDETFAPADVYFYWAMRGTNALETYDAIFVVGAPELPPSQIEAHVRAFMSRVPVAPGERRFEYQAESLTLSHEDGFAFVDANGDGAALIERTYLGTLEAFVWRVFHHDEYIQAILRGRPFDGARKKQIFFISNLMLGELETELVREAELLGDDLLARAHEVLEGGAGVTSMRQLARVLGVDPSAVSRAAKKRPKFWARYIAPSMRCPSPSS